jgi:hypothetical protein
MNFYIVFCKSRKKFDKYVKVNRIRNKVIIDIKQQIEVMQSEEEDFNIETYKDYFNLNIYTKISHSLKKGKDIYYLPNFDKDVNVEKILKMKKIFDMISSFNSLFIYEDFNDVPELQKRILSESTKYDSIQIIRDY